MAAATVNRSKPSSPLPYSYKLGKYPFVGSYTTVAGEFDEDGDAILLAPMPGPSDGASSDWLRLVNDQGNGFSFWIRVADLDSNGAPSLTFSVGFGDSDGVLDSTIITDSDVAQAGGVDFIDTGLSANSWDIAGKYLIIRATANAATEQVGAISWYISPERLPVLTFSDPDA